MNGYLLLLERYELEKESVSKWDTLDELFCHEEIEFHRQGMSLLGVFGSDKLCRYVEERDIARKGDLRYCCVNRCCGGVLVLVALCEKCSER